MMIITFEIIGLHCKLHENRNINIKCAKLSNGSMGSSFILLIRSNTGQRSCSLFNNATLMESNCR